MLCVEDAVVVNCEVSKQASTVCDKVGRSVRGLMNPSENLMPHLSQEAASCWQKIHFDDLANDAVDRKLRETKTANWCRTARSLIPLYISGAGNCLDVACAIAMWGSSSPANLLRRLIYVTLVEFGWMRYIDRWRRELCTQEGSADCLQSDDAERWEQVVKCAQPQQQDAGYPSFGESVPLSDAMQVFVLSNVLRRPVVVLCCTHHTGIRDTGGIYLPLLWKQEECVRYPLVLAHADGKFVPLVGGDGSAADMPSALDIVPLVTSQLEPLRVWFLLDHEEHEVYDLMQQYMNVTEVNLCTAESISMVLGARLKYQPLEEASEPLLRSSSVESSPRHVPTVRFQSSHASYMPQTAASTGNVSTATTHQTASTPAVDVSVTMTPCRHNQCTNLASSFIYPYCYQHIDEKIVAETSSLRATQRKQPQTSAMPPDMSLMSVGCKQAGCSNMCSVFVYPYCYEHIETRITEHHCSSSEQSPPEYLMSVSPNDCVYPGCANRASVNTYPVCYQHLDFFSDQQSLPPHQPQQQTPAATAGEGAASRHQSSSGYDKMMTELERSMRGSALRCRSGPGKCENFGNSRCDGYCHECYQLQQFTSTAY